MNKVAKTLAEYVVHKGMVDEADRKIYEYGFNIALEVGLFALASIIIAVCLAMPIEGILFFVIFTPLRSYAGGLHLEKFGSCFILSCLTYSAILLVVRNFKIPIIISFALLVLSEVMVYILYPVENINREVDEDENRYFRKKLIKFLFVDFFIGIVCIIFNRENFLMEMVMIFLLVVLTMLIGKYRNLKRDMC